MSICVGSFGIQSFLGAEMKNRGFSIAAWVVLLSVSTFAQHDKSTQLTIHIRDYCDPASFNAAIGPDTCVRDTSDGAITFSGFVAELGADQSAGAWRFAPGQIRVSQGTTLQLQNLGGETHTFTEVKRFGGGFLDFLNVASGNPVPAPECAQVVNGNLVPQPPSEENIFIPAGGSATLPLEHEVTAKYQCCIHPWMRTTITPKDQHHEQVH
jgi:plastocyanin